MEKVKITVEKEDGHKAEIKLTFNDDGSMEANIVFIPEVNIESKEYYLAVTSAIADMLLK